jgi:hypothetical protein
MPGAIAVRDPGGCPRCFTLSGSSWCRYGRSGVRGDDARTPHLVSRDVTAGR